MSDFRMPSLGADMEAGTLVEWLVQPGSAVKRGDIIAIVETQKGAIEIEVFQDGVLEEQLAAPGAKLPVGALMARISGDAGAAAEAKSAAPLTAPQAQAPIAIQTAAPSAGRRASPAARRRAQEAGVDLDSLAGSGPQGAITLADVDQAARSTKKAPGYDFTAMRKAIAAAMARSKREIPHYYLSHTIDVSAALDWLAAQNTGRAPADRLLIAPVYIKAVAKALAQFPEFNGFFDDGQFKPMTPIHAGVAIAIRGGGLVAPAIHDAQDLDIPLLMTKLRDLVARVRAGRFRSSEISDPTITITSLGDRGVDAVWGVIYPPQVAIVGFGRIAPRPWAVAGALAIRPTLAITLAADHRVSDGHRGALFLERLGDLLSEPATL